MAILTVIYVVVAGISLLGFARTPANARPHPAACLILALLWPVIAATLVLCLTITRLARWKESA